MKSFKDIKDLIELADIQMIDFKIVDIDGKYRHVTVPASNFSKELIQDGIGFDASNYGYAILEKSDMVFIPDLDTAVIDPFCEIPTLSIGGNAMIIDHPKNRPLPQYPRNVVKAAEDYMKKTGIADEMIILPEFEFYLFDEAGWEVSPRHIGFDVDYQAAHWNSDEDGHGNVTGYQKAYHIDKPFDTTFDVRSQMCMYLEEAGIPIKYHHPEVGSAGQFEIEPKLGKMSTMADASMMIKYIIRNTAEEYGMTATFMPKPVYKEAGSGMHVHMLLKKDGKPVFSDDKGYSHLSKTALYFIGGLLTHIGSLCAITNPSTNSYKRLVPGYEAPVNAVFATSNRSAVIRIPAYAKTPDLRRFELRNPDATCNPYYAYAAILMAGLDGVKKKIDPKKAGFGPYDVNLFNLPDEEKAKLKKLPESLDEALDELEKDYEYLLEGGVFTEDMIKNHIARKRVDAAEVSIVPHPAEYDKYYNC